MKKSRIIYAQLNGVEADELTTRDVQLVSRRSFIKNSSLFLPLSFFAGSIITAKASSVIKARTISAATQKAVQMSNSTSARSISLPAAWSKLRIGVLAHVLNNGASLAGEVIFAFGLNSGTTLKYGDATCQNFVGAVYDNTGGWTYVANSGAPYYTGFYTTVGGRVVVTTTVTSATAWGGGQVPLWNAGASLNLADRAMWAVDITKGSPNFSFKFPWRSSTSNSGVVAPDLSSSFLSLLPVISPSPPSGYDTASGTGSLAVSEGTNGTLNSLNLYWNRSDALMEVCGIGVAILA